MSGKNCCSPLDSQLLIAAIFARPPLWDRNNLLHKNNEFVESLWNEVSAELDSPKEILKSRWKGLKDTFRKESKKRGTKRTKWIHFKKLSFLKETDSDKSTNDSGGKTSDEETSEDVKEDLYLGEKGGEECKTEVKRKDDSKETDNKHNILAEVAAIETQTSFTSAGIPDTENESAFSSSEQVDSDVGRPIIWQNGDHFQRIDDDYHFFMSLVPHFKSLSPDQKLILRMKMQEIVYKEMFGSISN